MGGVGLVWAGEAWNLPYLIYADALAGLAVAAGILWGGPQLGRRTIDALLDAAPEGVQQENARAVARLHGAPGVCRARARRAGKPHFQGATRSAARPRNPQT